MVFINISEVKLQLSKREGLGGPAFDLQRVGGDACRARPSAFAHEHDRKEKIDQNEASGCEALRIAVRKSKS